MRAAIRRMAAPTSARERPFRTSCLACFRRSRAASAPISASGRPCGAAPDAAAAPAGHVPLPACELNSLLPESDSERPAAPPEASTSGAGMHLTLQRCAGAPRPGIPPHTSQSERNSCSYERRLRFCIASSNHSRKRDHRLSLVFFRQHARCKQWISAKIT